MYRTPGAQTEPSDDDDPHLILPGWGVGGGVVGRSTPDDVLLRFGSDARISRYANGDVFDISYDYDGAENYAPDRSENAGRPSDFKFARGLLREIDVSVYQTHLYTFGHVRVGSPRRAVEESFGEPMVVPAGDYGEELRYLTRGITFVVGRDDEAVMSIAIFQAAR